METSSCAVHPDIFLVLREEPRGEILRYLIHRQRLIPIGGKNQFKHAESIWSWRGGNSSTRQRQDDGDCCFLSPTDCAGIGLVLRYMTDMYISIRGRFLKAIIDGEMVTAIQSSFNVDVGRRGLLNDNPQSSSVSLTSCEFIEVKYLSLWMNRFTRWQ